MFKNFLTLTAAFSFFISHAFAQDLPDRNSFLKDFEWRLIDLVKINSDSKNIEGIEAIAKILKLELENLGLSAEWKPEARSLFAKNEVLNPKITILLMGHIDTVFPKESTFQDIKNIESDLPKEFLPVLSGPGITDCKAGLLQAIELVKYFKNEKQIQWKVLFTGDEETGSAFSKNLIKETARGATLVLNYEPGGLNFKTQNVFVPTHIGGSLWISAAIKTPKSHPGTESEPINAIGIGSEIVRAFLKLNDAPNKSIAVNPHKFLSESKSNVTASEAALNIAFRYNTESDRTKILATLEDLKLTYKDFALFQPQDRWRPVELTDNATFELLHEAEKKAGLPTISKINGLARGQSYFVAEEKIPVIDSMGPYGDGFHSEAEKVALGSAYDRLKLQTELIKILLEKNP